MNKTELVKEMKAHTGGAFITRHQLATFLGYSDVCSVDRFLQTAGRVGKGNFFIPDVALAIMEDSTARRA